MGSLCVFQARPHASYRLGSGAPDGFVGIRGSTTAVRMARHGGRWAKAACRVGWHLRAVRLDHVAWQMYFAGAPRV